MSLFPNQPFNLLGDHVFAKYDDSSYGLTNTTKYTDDKSLLDDYSQIALTAVLYAKLDISGEAIYDHLHSGLYMSPTAGDISATHDDSLKHEYKYIKTSMQNELDIDVYAK